MLLVDAGGVVAGLLISLIVPSDAGLLAMAATQSPLSEGNVAAVSVHPAVISKAGRSDAGLLALLMMAECTGTAAIIRAYVNHLFH